MKGSGGRLWHEPWGMNSAMPANNKAEINTEGWSLLILVRIVGDAHQVGCTSQQQRQQQNQTAKI
jgi:hypothetical protein